MKYLLMLTSGAGIRPAFGTEAFGRLMVGYREVAEEMASAGVLVDTGPLGDTSTLTTIRVREGRHVVTNGRSAEIGRRLDGYFVLHCPDLDAALAWAARVPAARYGAVEIRPVARLVADDGA